MQITINNEVFKLVSYECTLSFIEVGDSTTTLDGVDHVEGRKIKRSINATTIDLVRVEAYRLLQILKNTYLTVKYEDPISNTEETRVFILQNDPSLKTKMWKNDRQYYAGVPLQLLEKGAE